MYNPRITRKKEVVDLPTPIKTKNPVQNLPKSTIAFPELSTKSSGLAHRPQIQFGSGARTYVATTRRGRYFWNRAQERITSRKPIARTWWAVSTSYFWWGRDRKDWGRGGGIGNVRRRGK
jgi:hypothetical protein